MTSIGFEFPIDASGQWDGFNDPSMEHFTGDPFQHLGREVPQNTIDAKVGNPAKIRIALKKIKIGDIPDASTLKEVVARCTTAAQTDDSEKAQKFFQSATELLSKKDIPVLQISDSNTSGVKGPCENGKPFFALLKATGQSRKSETSTGSYGIGKFAPFTVSALRTVFVTTVWQDEVGSWHHYVQGKSVLMSYLDGENRTRRGTGFWGIKEGCMPISSLQSEVPEWLRRTDKDGSHIGLAGTTLSILGFNAVKGWEDVLAANIIMNFFGAIKAGHLEVEIDGSHQINSATLPDLLDSPQLTRVADEQDGDAGRFRNLSHYLQALEGGHGVAIESTQHHLLGECQLKILVGEKLPKRVAVLRNGMLITESMQRLKRFGEYKDFIAILECTSTKGQALLRGMEPPRHDAFEPERLAPDKRQQGRQALHYLAQWVREMLSRHAQDPVSEETNLDEMADFFADEEEEGAAKKKDENPAGAIIIRARPVKLKSRPAVYANHVDNTDDDGSGDANGSDDTSGEAEGEGENGSGGHAENESSGGNAPGANGGGAEKVGAQLLSLPVRDVRAILLTSKKRRIAFTPLSSGSARVILQDSGADVNRALTITASSAGSVSNGAVEGVETIAGQRVVLEVDLASDFVGTIRVVTDAV